ncbi:MAG: ankyrin repeat domain-containing protein, partial [Endozoicomonadaceae bacterium]|nr:ankyrin repeat domain-containing protein [Endozoicomonadaceae bacterium]
MSELDGGIKPHVLDWIEDRDLISIKRFIQYSTLCVNDEIALIARAVRTESFEILNFFSKQLDSYNNVNSTLSMFMPERLKTLSPSLEYYLSLISKPFEHPSNELTDVLFKENGFDLLKAIINKYIELNPIPQNGISIKYDLMQRCVESGNFDFLDYVSTLPESTQGRSAATMVLEWELLDQKWSATPLLISKCNAEVKDISNDCLKIAALNAPTEIVKLLVQNGLNHSIDEYETLTYAAEGGKVETLQYLMSLTSDSDLAEVLPEFLYHSSIFGNIEILELFLKHDVYGDLDLIQCIDMACSYEHFE